MAPTLIQRKILMRKFLSATVYSAVSLGVGLVLMGFAAYVISGIEGEAPDPADRLTPLMLILIAVRMLVFWLLVFGLVPAVVAFVLTPGHPAYVQSTNKGKELLRVS